VSPRAPRLEDTLAEIKGLDVRAEIDAEALAALRRALKSPHAFAVAKAAEIAAKREIAELEDDLARAFERFLVDPEKTDKGCRAKSKTCDALQMIRADRAALFRTGIRYRQMEKVWADHVDTAIGVRAASAMGLVRLNTPDAIDEVAELLADPEPPARRAAASALAHSGDPRAVTLLRFKAVAGDRDPSVTGECLSGLVADSPERAIPFVARFLEADSEPVAEFAALALGESRHADAFPPLRDWFENSARKSVVLRPTALTAIAMLRVEPAVDFLIAAVEGADARVSQAAFDAVERLYRGDEAVRRRAEEARIRGAAARE